MPVANWFVVALCTIGVMLLVLYARTGKMIRCTLFTAFTGAAALGMVWLLGKVTAITLALTPFTAGVSLLLGVPGVLAMLLLNMI